MASAPSTVPTTTSFDARPWPAETFWRLAMRLALAMPLVVLSAWAASQGWVSPEHARLIAQANALESSGVPLESIGLAYPPAPVAIAIVFGSATGLAVVSSFFAGSALHSAIDRLVRRRVSFGLIVVLVASVTLVPSIWYVASQNLATIGSLTMLVIAMEGFVRFAFAGETDGGFTAGLFLAAAFLFDPVVIAYAIALALAAPLLAHSRYRRERASVRATIAVLCFPVAAAVIGWAFFEWRFTGTVFSSLQSELELFAFPGGVLASFGEAVATIAGDILRVPLYLVVGSLLVARRPVAGVGYALPLVALVLTTWLGFSYSVVTTLLLLTFLAMLTVPFEPNRRTQLLIGLTALVQVAINVVWPPLGSGVGDWLNLF